MPIIGFILGSVFGLLVAAVAWLGFGAAFTTAVGVYLGFGISGGLLAFVSSGLGREEPVSAMAQPVRV